MTKLSTVLALGDESREFFSTQLGNIRNCEDFCALFIQEPENIPL